MAPGVGIEPTIAESKSVVLPLHYPGTKTGAVDGNRTRLNLIDNQVPYPEDYNGINLASYTGIDPVPSP